MDTEQKLPEQEISLAGETDVAEALGERVRTMLCQLAFEGGGSAQQVRSLELLAKILGLFEGRAEAARVTIVEDL